jgi:hypothetical protein
MREPRSFVVAAAAATLFVLSVANIDGPLYRTQHNATPTSHHLVTLYSGDRAVRTWRVDGDVVRYGNDYEFKDAVTDREVRVTGTVTVEDQP